jgi:3-dehydroquinate synthetase
MKQGSAIAERVVRVEAPSRGYDVIVGHGVSSSPALAGRVRQAAPRARRAMLVVDAGVPETRANALTAALHAAGLESVHDGSLRLRPDETMKVMGTVEALVTHMTAARLDRGDVAIVLGGGVLGDLVGFAAATYRRGIAWINMPTTLLAMVDASVGGKTGANVRVGAGLKKNMVGAFWQPSLVVADAAVLESLEARHLRCGLAECVKHGLLSADFGDPGLGDWTSANLAALLQRDAAALVELVARNVAVKARVVGRDEREEAPDADGGRALLNLGHTFGHAIETLPHLSPDGDPRHAPLHHGEAVGLGLVAAAHAAESMRLAPTGMGERVRAMVAAAGLPTRVRGLPSDDELLALMGDDKKVSKGQLRLVLPKGDGRCVVVSGPAREVVVAGWKGVREEGAGPRAEGRGA